MKGVLLAGGSGTRLHPITHSFSKQLLPVYDKPMIYYPLSLLMLAGIRDILLISTPRDLSYFESLLGNGSQWGISLTYAMQPQPKGIAQAMIIAGDKGFLDNESSMLVLGDNLIYGGGVTGMLEDAVDVVENGEAAAVIFGYHVEDPQRYGVAERDPKGVVLSLEEKPINPKSDLAVPGMYVYDERAYYIAKELAPSERGELEITDLNKVYLEEGTLHLMEFLRGTAWLDMGTHESLLQAAQFVQTVQLRQGMLMGSPEEIAWRHGWISGEDLLSITKTMGSSTYAKSLLKLLK